MRKLASIQRISEIKPIEGADLIVAARINGWWAVVKKGEFNIDQLVVYIECDAWVPTQLAPFLSKGKEPREYLGIKGERLRTIRLKKQLSQGLILPISVIGTWMLEQLFPNTRTMEGDSFEGNDVTDALGIIKWEPPVNPQLAGKTRGNFPSWLRKTDQERIQNCYRDVDLDFTWEISEKMEGSSMTVGVREGEPHVCSRNIDLKIDDVDNAFVKMADSCNVIPALVALSEQGRDYALQGELCGPGIQGNIYNFPQNRWFIFDVYDVRNGQYVTAAERHQIVDELVGLGAVLEHSPVISTQKLTGMSIDDILAYADGKSVFGNTLREGVVFKHVDNGENSWKAVSNQYLLGEK